MSVLRLYLHITLTAPHAGAAVLIYMTCSGITLTPPPPSAPPPSAPPSSAPPPSATIEAIEAIETPDEDREGKTPPPSIT